MWVKVYPPGTRRGRDYWTVRGKDQFGRSFEGKVPPSRAKNEAAARRYGKGLLEASNRDPLQPSDLTPPAPSEPDRTFRAAAEAWRKHRTPSKVEWARVERILSWPAIARAHVKDLATDDIVTFVTATRNPTSKPDTHNREAVGPYAAVLHHAADNNWRSHIRIRLFKEQQDERPAASAATMDLLVANADATHTYSRGAHKRIDRRAPYKIVLLEFLRLRGSRLGDALKLRHSNDLDLQAGLVRLTIGKARDKVKWLPLSTELVAMLANLAPCDGVFVFPWRSRSGVYKWLKPLRQRLGLAFTPHMARHALAEELIDLDTDLFTVQDAGAWASLNSVRPYARASHRRLREVDERRKTARGKKT